MKKIKISKLMLMMLLLTGMLICIPSCGDYYYQSEWVYKLINDDTEYEVVRAKSGTHITVPEIYNGKPVTSIGQYAFINPPNGETDYGNRNLKSVSLPNTIKKIKYWAFLNASNLEKVAFANGCALETIEYAAFADCKSLKKINIPDTVTYIEKDAFRNCNSLETIDIPDTITNIGTGAFDGTKWFSNQRGIIYIGNILYGCNGTVPADVVVPDNIISIADSALRENSQIKSITFGLNSRLTAIGWSAFYACSELKSVVIPKTVTVIGSEFKSVFDECEKLETVYYGGANQEEFDLIGIEKFPGNRSLYNAELYFYSENTPLDEGYYWRYVNGISTAW